MLDDVPVAPTDLNALEIEAELVPQACSCRDPDPIVLGDVDIPEPGDEVAHGLGNVEKGHGHVIKLPARPKAFAGEFPSLGGAAANLAGIENDQTSAAIFVVDAADDELLPAVAVEVVISEVSQVAGVPELPDHLAGGVEHGQLAGPVGRLERFDDGLEPAVAVEVVRMEAGDAVARREDLPSAHELPPGVEAPELDALAVIAVYETLPRLVADPLRGEEDLRVAIAVDVPDDEGGEHIRLVLVYHLEVPAIEVLQQEVFHFGVLPPELPFVLVADDEHGPFDREIGGLAPDPARLDDEERPG